MAHRKLLAAVVVALELTACGMTASTPPARGFLSQLPRNQMTEADQVLYDKALQDALENTPDGQTQTWRNDATGARGTIKPTRTFQHDGMKCRAMAISTDAQGQAADWHFNLCKTAEGQWKQVSL